ncbi:hypothetical protein QCA50_003272 [Cerrena zonata]|uniref:ABC transporter domain-containing protein n=1 Tax=Cerrena zonata TaxID=2478898 RepID=A0AAW0GLT8_9APHY
MPETLLELRNVAVYKAPGQPIITDVNFDVLDRDIIILQGKSGSGKSTLLKALAHLNLYEGEIAYRGKTPQSYGIPNFRTKILYVPQRPSLLPGTPREFLQVVSGFKSHRGRTTLSIDDPIRVAAEWGIEEELWDRNWSNLSGGESQRIALATAIGMKTAEVLLLDEPTSALDAQSSAAVEDYIIQSLKSADSNLKAAVWITHSEEQGKRVGSRFLRIANGTAQEEASSV